MLVRQTENASAHFQPVNQAVLPELRSLRAYVTSARMANKGPPEVAANGTNHLVDELHLPLDSEHLVLQKIHSGTPLAGPGGFPQFFTFLGFSAAF
jgi:hypothetical protein